MRQSVFFVQFSGDLAADERDRLASDPDYKLYENGIGVGAFYPATESGPSEITSYHVVRVSAVDEEDAKTQVIAALRRQPEDLRAHAGKSE